MVAEILAGIALAKSAVSGIKSAIETAKDVNDVAHHLDDLLTGYDQSKRKTQKKKPKGNKAWTRYLGSKLKDQDDDISLSQITSEVIEQKQIEEQIQSIKRMMNKRFGPGTWDEILKLRQERIDERKKEIAAAKAEAELRSVNEKDIYDKVIMFMWQIPVVGICVLGMWWGLSIASKGNLPFPFW